ncbi:integrase [Neorhizobium galegae]|nr:integrase [Neorhizobium galegae]KAB1115807.1 integrase [Neorhizobium galegae]
MRTPAILIPVLVTGIQQRRVCGAIDSFQPKDLGWLDSCDKHRNEDMFRPANEATS